MHPLYTITLADLDGNESEEALAFYHLPQGDVKIHGLILKQMNSTWEVVRHGRKIVF